MSHGKLETQIGACPKQLSLTGSTTPFPHVCLYLRTLPQAAVSRLLRADSPQKLPRTPKEESTPLSPCPRPQSSSLPAALAVAAVPAVLGAVGFTGAGIAASSFAAKMMSAAAVANGGGVAAGGLVATLQSVGKGPGRERSAGSRGEEGPTSTRVARGSA